MSSRSLPPADEYIEGVRSGSLSWLARAITLVESTNEEHHRMALSVLRSLSESAGDKPEAASASSSDPSSALFASPSASSPAASAHRVGVTGAPAAGKSTFLDALGERLCEQGRRVAVLAVDPSSAVGGGSILGDKTRMSRLAANPSAFVRPSPSGGAQSGVTGTTLEAILLLECVGFDVIFVETVGAGQSTLGVADLTDSVLTLVAPDVGDDLQGIKRGLLELTDVLMINKADGEGLRAARRTAANYESALRLLRPSVGGWRTPVLTASALEGTGIEEVWERLCEHRSALSVGGHWAKRRGEQRVRWMWHLIERGVLAAFRRRSQAPADIGEIIEDVRSGRLLPAQAAVRMTSSLGAS